MTFNYLSGLAMVFPVRISVVKRHCIWEITNGTKLEWRTKSRRSTIDSTKHEQPVADLRGGARDAPPSPKFLHFHAVFGKNWPNSRWAPPPLGLAPPPLGNPGSATANCCLKFKQ